MERTLYDFTVGIVVIGLAITKTLELARAQNWLPAKKAALPNKTDELQTWLRQELRDQFGEIAISQDIADEKVITKLEAINLGIREIATILQERR